MKKILSVVSLLALFCFICSKLSELQKTEFRKKEVASAFEKDIINVGIKRELSKEDLVNPPKIILRNTGLSELIVSDAEGNFGRSITRSNGLVMILMVREVELNVTRNRGIMPVVPQGNEFMSVNTSDQQPFEVTIRNLSGQTLVLKNKDGRKGILPHKGFIKIQVSSGDNLIIDLEIGEPDKQKGPIPVLLHLSLPTHLT